MIQEIETEKLALRERGGAKDAGVDSKSGLEKLNERLTPIKKQFWQLQREVLPRLIHIPNELHSSTPDEPSVIN